MAFEAWGATLEELFSAAADATMNVMVEELAAILSRERRAIALSAEALDMLLFEFLQELIYLKDADQLLLRIREIRIAEGDGAFRLAAEAAGETIDPTRHPLNVDVKAVTLHRFVVERADGGWRATVILDI